MILFYLVFFSLQKKRSFLHNKKFIAHQVNSTTARSVATNKYPLLIWCMRALGVLANERRAR